MAKMPAVTPEVKEPVVNGSNLDSTELLGYQFSGVADKATSIAKAIYAKFPNFLEGLADEDKAKLKRGMMLRQKENNPAEEYGYITMNGSRHFVKVSPTMTEKPKETMWLDSDIALAYTPHEFGKLKADDNDKYQVLLNLRRAGIKYTSNKFRAITTEIKTLLNPDAGSRKAISEFVVYMTELFSDADSRVKVSQKVRGDTTANPDKFKKAEKAFWAEYNKA